MTYKEAVNSLTNWQRNQWARGILHSGESYPGSNREEVDKVVPYLLLSKENRNAMLRQ